jgi:hypothetical protein
MVAGEQLWADLKSLVRLLQQLRFQQPAFIACATSLSATCGFGAETGDGRACTNPMRRPHTACTT